MLTYVTKKELLLILLLSCAVSLSTIIPNLIKIKTQDPSMVQTWTSTRSPWDTYTYISWIEQARQGNYLFTDLYTNDSQTKIFFHPIFLFLGIGARVVHISSMAAYQVGRVASGAMLLISLYIFISRAWEDKTTRLLSWLLAAVGSGFGLITGALSTDMWMTENNAYFGMSDTLLNSCSLVLLLLLSMVWVENIEQRPRKAGILAGLLLLGLSLTHTYYIPLALAIIGAYTFLRYYKTQGSQIVLGFAYALTFGLIGVLWQTHVLGENPVLGIWAFLQSNVPAPQIFSYTSGLGLVLIFGIVGMGALRLEQSELSRYTVIGLIWLGVSLIFLYNPFLTSLSRKYAEGIQPMLAVFAGGGLLWAATHATQILRVRRMFLLSLFLLLSGMSTLAWLVFDSGYNPYTLTPQFINQEQSQALEWMKQNIPSKQTVMAGPAMGNLIPGLTGLPVYYGHYDQTVSSEQKLALTKGVLSKPIIHSDPLRSFIGQQNIRYIVEDMEVRSWGAAHLQTRPYLQMLFHNNEVKIYQVSL